jgi:hypothetical protein
VRDLADAEKPYARLERELAEERAAALRRIASTLESILERLLRARARAAAAAGVERESCIAEYAQLRRQAELYRWYLVVQREAVGLCRHELLDELYRIPEPLA